MPSVWKVHGLRTRSPHRRAVLSARRVCSPTSHVAQKMARRQEDAWPACCAHPAHGATDGLRPACRALTSPVGLEKWPLSDAARASCAHGASWGTALHPLFRCFVLVACAHISLVSGHGSPPPVCPHEVDSSLLGLLRPLPPLGRAFRPRLVTPPRRLSTSPPSWMWVL